MDEFKIPPMPIIGFRVETRLSESARTLQALPSVGPDGQEGGRKFTGVTLIKAGLGNSRDRNYYPPETLQRAVREGRFSKLRAYIDHPDEVSEQIQPERTVRDWAGVYTNARYNPERKTVEADLTVFRSHKWLADTVEDLQRMGHGDMIGLSINGRGKTEPARRRLEEAGGEEVEVNEVRDFLELRSTDIVTEAGAGGGFVADMLESARRGAQGETTMAGKLKKKTPPVVDRNDEAQDDLAEAAEDVKDESVAQLASAEDDVVVDEDEDEDDVVDGDDEDEDDDEVEESNTESTNAFVTNAQRLKQQAARSQQVAEASGRRKIIGATGTTGTVNKKNTHFTKRDPGSTRGARVNTKRTMGVKTVRPGATVSVSEAAHGDRSLLRENAALAQENRTLRERNAKLAEALNTHRTADHAQRLLESSDIPARLHPGYLRKMIGMSERDMTAFIDDKLTEIDAITEAAHSRIEGAGSTIRESYHGGASAGGGLGDAFAGIPVKAR
jgi:hypothetical protein